MQFITAIDLNEILTQNEKQMFVMDIRSDLEYNKQRIPSSKLFAFPKILFRRIVKVCVSTSTLNQFLMDDISFKERTIDSIIVLYDNETGASTKTDITSPLGFFYNHFKNVELLNTFVLDGGFTSWTASGFATTSTAPTIRDNLDKSFADDSNDENIDFPIDFKPSLYGFIHIGSLGTACNAKLLKANGITHILNVSGKPSDLSILDTFKCLDNPINDSVSQDILSTFPDNFAFIDDARKSDGKVLVHCMAGISRSVSIVIAYLMYNYKLSVKTAMDQVREFRPCASPNLGFCGQLFKFDSILQSNIDNSNNIYDIIDKCKSQIYKK